MHLMKFVRLAWSVKIVKQYTDEFARLNGVYDVYGDTLHVKNIYYDKWFRYIATKELIPEYDVYRVWAMGWRYKHMALSMVYYYGQLLKKRFLDSICIGQTPYTKMMEHICFDTYGYPTLKTMFFCPSKKTIDRIQQIVVDEFSFPLIVKDPTEDRGEWVVKLENISELEKYIHDYVCSWSDAWVLVQEFYEAPCDYRALVIGDRVIGWFQRANSSSFKHNIAQWAVAEAIEFPIEIKNLCVEVTRSLGLDIGGVDFFWDGWTDVRLIEVNKMPQYAGFEEATWKSFIQNVFAYLAKKYQENA